MITNVGKVKIKLGAAVQKSRVPAREIDPKTFPIIVQWFRGERSADSRAPVGRVTVGTPVGTIQLSFFENNGEFSLSKSLNYCKLLLPEDLQTNILEEIERQARGEIEFTITSWEFTSMSAGSFIGRLNVTTEEFGTVYGVMVCKSRDGRIYIKEPTNYKKEAEVVEVGEGEVYYPSTYFEIGSIARKEGKFLVNETNNPSGGVTLSKSASMAILEVAKLIVGGELPEDPQNRKASRKSTATQAAAAEAAAEVEQEDLEAVRV